MKKLSEIWGLSYFVLKLYTVHQSEFKETVMKKGRYNRLFVKFIRIFNLRGYILSFQHSNCYHLSQFASSKIQLLIINF